MRYALRQIPALLRTPVGRRSIRDGANFRLWPLTSRLARAYRRTLARRTRVIAVVGSLGKSTTARAVAEVLGLPFDRSSLRNCWSSVAYALLRIRPRQPRAVIEVGIAAPGQMAAYGRVVRPDIVIVTSIASEHNRSLGTLETTRLEKSQMVRALPASGIALLNGDDPNVCWMRELAPKAYTFGFGEDCDVRAIDVRLQWPHGTTFRVCAFGLEREVTIRLVGRSMVYAALAALAVAHLEGVGLDEGARRIAAMAPTPGRMDPVPLANGVVVLRDDFKSTLESIHSALDVLADIQARRIVVLGDVSEPPGSQGPIYRAIGARVAGIAACLIPVGGQGSGSYRSGARDAGMPEEAIIDGGRTPRTAAEALQRVLQPGDVVLIKGRDNQMLDRVRLILEGRDVRCDIRTCHVRTIMCARCPMLERGWEGRRIVT
jgi:UDP-N-acetylmuramoyl-tripeptide--D-alanyl-D-alanine ligase